MNNVKRVRRTAEDIDKDILTAAGILIKEHGFAHVTTSAVLECAKVEPNVFYKRFKDLDDLFDKYVRQYDYWLNDSFNFDKVRFKPIENCENLLLGLVDALNGNEIMQKLLAWEITELNYITERTSSNRERHSHPLIDYFQDTYSDPKLDIRVVSALLIAGIYYLCLHKRLSSFCEVDFNTPEGIELLKNNITEIVKRVYQNSPNGIKKGSRPVTPPDSNPVYSIAKSLWEQGVDREIILTSTGLTPEELERLCRE